MSLVGTTQLINAIKKDQTSYAEFLIKNHKVDINETDKYEKTPLIHAVLQGNKTIIGLLLDKGADVNKKDKSSRAAIDYAVKGDHEINSMILTRISKIADKQLRSRRRTISKRTPMAASPIRITREKSYDSPLVPNRRQEPNNPPSHRPPSRKTKGGKKSKRKTSKK